MVSEKLVPAKVILFGEYAVLKGTKAIAFAINRFGKAKKSTGVTVIDPTKKVDLSAEFPTINGLEITLDISLGSGLGSSAVVSVLLADIAIDKEFPEANKIVDISNNLSDEKLNKALQIENVFHGVSSGLDVTTSYVTGLIVYQNYSYTRLDAQHINKYKILIFDSKITKNTKNASCKAVMTEEMIIEIDKITKEAERLLSSAFDISELYKLIRRNQDLLDEMKIVPESMSKEIQKQRMRGIESKITGAGFGGHLVTVVEKDVQIEGWEDVSIYEQ